MEVLDQPHVGQKNLPVEGMSLVGRDGYQFRDRLSLTGDQFVIRDGDDSGHNEEGHHHDADAEKHHRRAATPGGMVENGRR